MVFSSLIFLFVFLPCVLLLYNLSKNIKARNAVLLIASLVFYAWGEPFWICLLLVSVFFNWWISIRISKSERPKAWLVPAVIFNISTLVFFKYTNFIFDNLNPIFHTSLHMDIAMPIGISFFTFQAMSYVIDVYRGEKPESLANVGLYIALFPQLVAGPIVRYDSVREQLTKRTVDLPHFTEGVKRFILGLGKKVIFANNFAIIADDVFDGNVERTLAVAWLGAISYTLQIFFDFSGYSDMAIGLGLMFGFRFEENFNYPYIANSVTDFWRRWHMSLSSWFRDYVYIPLGGNRVSAGRHLLNLFVVWALTGLWHGANWTFIVWGIGYFLLLVFEKYSGITKVFKKIPAIGHVYTLFFVNLAWVLFRAENITSAGVYIRDMFTVTKGWVGPYFESYIMEYGIVFLLSGLLLVPIKTENKVLKVIKDIVLIFMFVVSVGSIVKGNYSPFIYFNF